MTPPGLVRCDVESITDVSAQFGFNTCINCPERCARIPRTVLVCVHLVSTPASEPPGRVMDVNEPMS